MNAVYLQSFVFLNSSVSQTLPASILPGAVPLAGTAVLQMLLFLAGGSHAMGWAQEGRTMRPAAPSAGAGWPGVPLAIVPPAQMCP